jgi:hypothetical protein
LEDVALSADEKQLRRGEDLENLVDCSVGGDPEIMLPAIGQADPALMAESVA